MKMGINKRMKEWQDLDPSDVCKNCGHPRSVHDDFENCLGNDRHSCCYEKQDGRSTLRCTCTRFELASKKDLNAIQKEQEDRLRCTHCGGKRSYNEQYDAYYCKKCDYWMERICPDKDCEYCSERPKYPSDGGR